jgi:hypothetical protein
MKKIVQSPLLPISVFPALLLAPVYLCGKALFWGTISTQFVPWWNFSWESLLSGQLPLWNPFLGMGAPLAANYQSALFYPATWIYLVFYAVGGIKLMAWSISLVVAAHLIWAGWGMVRLLADLHVGKTGQVISGLAFALSGYLVSRAGFLSINATAAWLPWVLLSSKRLVSSAKGSILYTGLTIGALLLAGHAQIAWYILILDGMWALFWVLKKSGDRKGWKITLSRFGRLFGAGALGLALSAVQLIPTLEYLLESHRAIEYGYAQAMTYSFWPWRFLTFLAPGIFGNPARGNYWGYGNFWEDAIYIGFAPLMLAVGMGWRSIFQRNKAKIDRERSDLAVFLIAVCIVSVVLALGDHTPVFPFLYRNVPTFDLFQGPTRFSIWAVFSLAVLAGLGCDLLKQPKDKGIYWNRLAVAGSGAVTGSAALAWCYFKDVKTTFITSIGLAGLWCLGFTLLRLFKPERGQDRKYAIWNLLIILLVGLDLTAAGWGLNPGVEVEFYSPGKHSAPDNRVMLPARLEYELKINQFFRFDTFYPHRRWTELRSFWLPDTGMLDHVEMVNNFDPLLTGRYQDWIETVDHLLEQSEGWEPEHPALRLMALGSIVSESSSGQPLLVQITEQNLPRLWLVENHRYVEDEREALETIFWGSFDLEREVITTEPLLEEQEICESDIEGQVQRLLEKPGYLRLQVSAPCSSWVVWSQSWYPGWRTIIDNTPAGWAYRVDYLFQASRVKAGEHTVEFVYRPLSYIAGGLISAMAILAIGIWALAARRPSK